MTNDGPDCTGEGCYGYHVGEDDTHVSAERAATYDSALDDLESTPHGRERAAKLYRMAVEFPEFLERVK